MYLVFAGTFHSIFLKGRLGPAFDEGAGATWLEAGIAIALTWLTVGARHRAPRGLEVAAEPGGGGEGRDLPGPGRPRASSSSSRARLPRTTSRFRASCPSWGDSLAFLPILLYNTLGFELMSSAGEEMKEPQKDVPRVVLLSGAIICVVYMLGALGILLVVPLEKLSLLTGTWDALALLGPAVGHGGEALTLVLGIGFLYACIANVVTWSLGVNRVAAAAAEDHMAPAVLGRLHPRFKTPYVAFVIMGAVGHRAARGQRAPVQQPLERLLDDLQAVEPVPASVLPHDVPGVPGPALHAPGPAAAVPPARRACPRPGPSPWSAGSSCS